MKIRDITLEPDGIDVEARLYIPDGAEIAPVPAVCISHGIPSGQPHDSDDRGYPGVAEDVCAQGIAALIFSFRGTGGSGGNLDIPGWVNDLRAAVDWLMTVPEVDSARVSLMGSSAGAAVSVRVGAEDSRVASVIACACPAAMQYGNPEAAIAHFKEIGLIRDAGFPASVEEWQRGFEAANAISVVDRISPRPLLLINGAEDEVVPVREAYRLYEKAGQPKQLIVMDGTGHRIRHDPRVISIAIDWLKRLP